MASIHTSSSYPNLRRNLEFVRLQTRRQGELDERMEDLQGIKTDLNMVDPFETTSYSGPSGRAPSLSPSSSSTSLAGVSIEHRMISDLRNQLESQASENKKLRQQIEGATARQAYSLSSLDTMPTPLINLGTVRRSPPNVHISTVPSVTETVESILARGTRRSPIQNVPLPSESATEILFRKQLSDAQAEISLLNEKLRNCETTSDKQKTQFRMGVQDLQSRLSETIVGRDSVLELRKRESDGQEKMITQLQQSLKDIEGAYRQQEKSLREAHHKIESLQHSATSSASALQQIRVLVTPRDWRAGDTTAYASPSNLEEDTGRFPPTHVVRLVEEGFRDRQGRVMELEKAATDARKEVAETREAVDEKMRTLAAEHREKLMQLSEDQEKQMEALTERALNARKQATGLQAQLSDLREQSSHQMDLKTKECYNLEIRFEGLQKDAESDRQTSQQKIDELTSELEAYTNDMQAARQEISNLQLKLADSSLTLQSNKETLLAVQSELKAEHEKTKDLRSQDGQRLANIQRELEARSLEVRHLGEMLTSYKERATTQLEQRLFEVQCEEQRKAVDKTSQLLAEIESLKAENSKLSSEMLKKTADFEQSHQNRDRLSAVLEETTAKLESVQVDREQLTKQLEEKTNGLEIVTRERDHYLQLCEDGNRELDSLNSLQNRLQMQVTEKEQQLEEFRQQRTSLSQVVESNERTNAEARREREGLIKLLDEKTKELQQVKGAKDDLNKKLRVREKRLQSLEAEYKTVTDALEEKNNEMEKVIGDKEGLLVELKSVQEKVSNLTVERETLEARCVELEASREKSSSHRQLRIQALEHDLQLTLEALGATKSAVAKAVNVAENLQKELLSKRSQIDSLQIRTHWLEESLSAASKERSMIEVEKGLLEEQVATMKEQMERLQSKLRSVADRRNSHKDMVSKLESALEKAALKHTDAQRVIEEQEQAIAKVKLSHQLEMKALQRTLASKLAPLQMAAKNDANRISDKHGGIQKTQSTESTTTLTKVTSGIGKSAAGMVSAHFLRSASMQATEGFAGRNYVTPVPVVIMNTSTQAEVEKREKSASAEMDQNVSGELKDLLLEMKNVFSANMKALKSSTMTKITSTEKLKEQIEEEDKHASKKTRENPDKAKYRGLLIPARDVQSAPVLNPPATKTADVMDPPLLTSSPFKIDKSVSAPMDQHPSQPANHRYSRLRPQRDPDLNAPPSPVANLLGIHNGVCYPSLQCAHNPALRGMGIAAPLRVHVPAPGDLAAKVGDFLREDRRSAVRNKNSHRDENNQGFGDVNAAKKLVTSDDDTCSSITTVTSDSNVSSLGMGHPVHTNNLRSLQEKLRALSHMGSQLQQGNKEVAGLIKRQDVKLKRCRQEERQVNRIVNSK